jgi:hypothetical protein
MLAILAALAWGAWDWRELNVRPLRRALPSSAADVHEWGYADGFLPDFTYLLKARINPDEFQSYVKKARMTPHTADRKYDDDDTWLNWRFRGSCHETWWDPSDSIENTFVRNHGEEWGYAKYENGYIYVKSLDH